MPSSPKRTGDDEVDGRIHVRVKGRTGALEDPGQPDRDGLAGADRRVVGDAVEREPERAAGALAADRVPVLLAAEGHAPLAARERVAADPEGLRGEHQVLHHQAFLDAVHVDHLPPLEVPQVDGVRVVEQSRLHERPQRVVAELPVDEVVAVRAVEVEEHRRDALPRDVRDRV